MASSRRRFLLSAAAFGGAAMVRPTSPAIAAAAPKPVAAGQTPTTAAATGQADTVFAYRRNWGRWGPDDPMGAVNLITPQKRAAAAALVRTGRTVSLSRVFEPDQHFMRISGAGPAAEARPSTITD